MGLSYWSAVYKEVLYSCQSQPIFGLLGVNGNVCDCEKRGWGKSGNERGKRKTRYRHYWRGYPPPSPPSGSSWQTRPRTWMRPDPASERWPVNTRGSFWNMTYSKDSAQILSNFVLNYSFSQVFSYPYHLHIIVESKAKQSHSLTHHSSSPFPLITPANQGTNFPLAIILTFSATLLRLSHPSSSTLC